MDDSSTDTIQQTTFSLHYLHNPQMKRAAEMFGALSKGSDGGESSTSSSVTNAAATPAQGNITNGNDHNNKGGSGSNGNNAGTGGAVLSDIKEGAERLANELDDYISNSPNNNNDKKPFFRTKDAPPLSDEAVADLQLATARKLREVRLAWLVNMFYFTDC